MRKAGVPVFYDATGTRKMWVTLAGIATLILLCAAAAWVTASLFLPPVLPSWTAFPGAVTASDQTIGDIPVRRDGHGEILAPRVMRSDSQPDLSLLHHF